MNYSDFLAQKAVIHPPTGIQNVGDLHPSLFGFQRDCVRWALRRGRAALSRHRRRGQPSQAPSGSSQAMRAW